MAAKAETKPTTPATEKTPKKVMTEAEKRTRFKTDATKLLAALIRAEKTTILLLKRDDGSNAQITAFRVAFATRLEALESASKGRAIVAEDAIPDA